MLACLSPQEMWISEQVGYYAFALGLGLGLASLLVALKQKKWDWAIVSSLLVSFHPVWTIGVTSGDCGEAKRFYSGVVSMLLIAVLGLQLFAPDFPKRRFAVVLCLAAWSGYLFDRIFLPLTAAYLLPDLEANSVGGRIMFTFIISLSQLMGPALLLTVICLVWFAPDWIRSRWQKPSPT